MVCGDATQDPTGLASPVNRLQVWCHGGALITLQHSGAGLWIRCESLFLSGSLDDKDFVKHPMSVLIQHLAHLVPQSKVPGAAW